MLERSSVQPLGRIALPHLHLLKSSSSALNAAYRVKLTLSWAWTHCLRILCWSRQARPYLNQQMLAMFPQQELRNKLKPNSRLTSTTQRLNRLKLWAHRHNKLLPLNNKPLRKTQVYCKWEKMKWVNRWIKRIVAVMLPFANYILLRKLKLSVKRISNYCASIAFCLIDTKIMKLYQ